jgi:hypothetical protein
VTLLASSVAPYPGIAAAAVADTRSSKAGNRLRIARSALPSTGVRLAGAAIAAVAVSHLHVAGRPATCCPLRALTGIPCPLCGGTTAAARLGRLDVVGALAANPVAVLFGVALIAAPLALGRGGLDRLSSDGRRKLTRAVVVALAFSEVWQLVRFGVW